MGSGWGALFESRGLNLISGRRKIFYCRQALTPIVQYTSRSSGAWDSNRYTFPGPWERVARSTTTSLGATGAVWPVAGSEGGTSSCSQRSRRVTVYSSASVVSSQSSCHVTLISLEPCVGLPSASVPRLYKTTATSLHKEDGYAWYVGA